MNGNLSEKRRWLRFSFNQFPAILNRMLEVSSTDKVVLSCMLSRIRARGRGLCFPSKVQIADDAGTTTKTVRRSIYKWQDLGLISVIKDNLGRTNYILNNIPEWIIDKYGDDKDRRIYMENIEARMKDARKAVEKAEEKSQDVAIEKRAKLLSRAREAVNTPKTFKSIPMPKEPNETVKIALKYGELIDHYFNSGKDNKIKVPISKKESGQIKTFITAYGYDSTLRVMNEIFARWDYYKAKWGLEADYPTIGILVTYGKGKIFTASRNPQITQEIFNQVPQKVDPDEAQIEPGW